MVLLNIASLEAVLLGASGATEIGHAGVEAGVGLEALSAREDHHLHLLEQRVLGVWHWAKVLNHCRLILLVGPDEEDLAPVEKEEVGLQLHERLDKRVNRFAHEDALESSLLQLLDEGEVWDNFLSKLLNEFDALVAVLKG